MSFFNPFFGIPFFSNYFGFPSTQTTYSVAENSIVYDVLPTSTPAPFVNPFNLYSWFYSGINSSNSIISINGVSVGNHQSVILPSGASISILNAATGLFSYSPNTAIDVLPGQPFIDSFSYTFFNGFLVYPFTLHAQVVVFDGGITPPPPSPVTPQFTQFSDDLDLNTITNADINNVGLAAYQSALAGDDYAVLPNDGTPLTQAGFYNTPFQANSGDDTIVINGAVGIALNQVITVEGNSGEDNFFVEGSGQQVGQLLLEGGAGADQYNIDNATLITEITIDDNGLLEDDTLTLTAPVSNSMLDLGLGADSYNIGGNLDNTSILDEDGAELIFINGSMSNGSFIEILPNATIDSSIVITDNIDASFITTGAGNDEISILNTVLNSQINANNGNNTITSNALNNSTIRFGAGENTVIVLPGGDMVNNSVILDNQLTSVLTDTLGDQITIQGRILDTSSILLANGSHVINIGEVLGTDVNNPVSISTLDGDDLLDVTTNIQAATISLGSGDDSIAALSLNLSQVDMGYGMDSLTIDNNISNSEIDMGTGLGNRVSADMISNSTITSGGSNADDGTDNTLSVTAINVTSTLYQLLDTLNGNQLTLNDSIISNSSNINGSNSNDMIILNQTNFFDSGTIDLAQAGSDQLILTGLFSSINGSTLILGNGDELIEDQTSTGSASFESNTVFIVSDAAPSTNVTFNISVIENSMTIDDSAAGINSVTFNNGLFGTVLTGSSGRDVINATIISSNALTSSSINLQDGNDLLMGINHPLGLPPSLALIAEATVDMGLGEDTIDDFFEIMQTTLLLGEGNDTVTNIQSISNSILFGDSGNDQLTNINRIEASQLLLEGDDDTLIASQVDSNSIVDAGQGNDTINIAIGADSTVFDGEGMDEVTLGAGNIDIISQTTMGIPGDGFADTFIFVGSTSVADHSITGFTQNEDVIDLTSFGLTSAADLNFQFDGSDTTLSSINNPNYEITVIGVELTAADVGTDIII
ncbi:MAG: hypothetical protein GKR77_04770 [Legionellales bacterium]|nr:hypothetical protein [Legionellales bacterium]